MALLKECSVLCVARAINMAPLTGWRMSLCVADTVPEMFVAGRFTSYDIAPIFNC